MIFSPSGVMLSVDFILFCYVDILYCVTEAPLLLISENFHPSVMDVAFCMIFILHLLISLHDFLF